MRSGRLALADIVVPLLGWPHSYSAAYLVPFMALLEGERRGERRQARAGQLQGVRHREERRQDRSEDMTASICS